MYQHFYRLKNNIAYTIKKDIYKLFYLYISKENRIKKNDIK